MEITRIAIAVAAVAVSVTACSSAPETGTITNANYNPAWVQVIPAVPGICTGNPPVCTPSTPMQIIPWPDTWEVEITSGSGEHGWRDVTQIEFERCSRGSRFPECLRKP